MIRLEGKTFKANLVTRVAVCERELSKKSYSEDLGICLTDLCKSMDVPLPMWLKKNTKEFGQFRQTIFFEDQFTQEIDFDRLQIKLLKT